MRLDLLCSTLGSLERRVQVMTIAAGLNGSALGGVIWMVGDHPVWHGALPFGALGLVLGVGLCFGGGYIGASALISRRGSTVATRLVGVGTYLHVTMAVALTVAHFGGESRLAVLAAVGALVSHGVAAAALLQLGRGLESQHRVRAHRRVIGGLAVGQLVAGVGYVAAALLTPLIVVGVALLVVPVLAVGVVFATWLGPDPAPALARPSARGGRSRSSHWRKK